MKDLVMSRKFWTTVVGADCGCGVDCVKSVLLILIWMRMLQPG